MKPRDFRKVLLLPMLASLSVCTTDPEPLASVVFEGVVTSAGPSTPASGVEVLAVSPRQSVSGSTTTDEAGAYRLEVSAVVGCSARVVAVIRDRPFSVESDPEFIPNPGGPCVGVLPGPELILPEASSTLDTARVVGTVTSGGQPASAVVTLFVDSFADGPITVGETTTDSTGAYEVEGAVPPYYCNNLEVRTDPAALARWPVSGCSSSLVDIVVGG